MARVLAAIAALVAWLGLALQLLLLIGQFADTGQSAAAAIWRYVGFFTILTNIFIAVVASAAALTPYHRLASAQMRFSALVTILLVGITFSLALRHLAQLNGWDAIANHALHDATPLLFLFFWLVARDGTLGWRDIVWGVVPGFLYFLYALARGAYDGWYAYYFLNPVTLTLPEFLRNIVLLLIGISGLAALFVAIDKGLARWQGQPI
ncbi:Pr6Pr family membrane protein [Sphingopyxis witflariensis]|uniref:Pr6Pr family membrane protein n=1 Tax=Sphingopyxis witflariensis TaxID=173675 RepID=UPI001181B313|nr:Pr6Pr family membrane protein [Sphingopyxis witflariensis]